jgi:hypothetical protein
MNHQNPSVESLEAELLAFKAQHRAELEQVLEAAGDRVVRFEGESGYEETGCGWSKGSTHVLKKPSSRASAGSRYRAVEQTDPNADPMAVLAGMDAAALSRQPFGLYNVQLNRKPERFGTPEAQMDDVAMLGAGILRENGVVDLTWEDLSPEPHEVPEGRPEVMDQILGIRNIVRLKNIFIEAQSRGIRLILRCPMGDERKLVSGDGTYPVGTAEPLTLKWSASHPEALVGVDSTEILDIRNSYHRKYLGYMMEGIAQLLRLVAESLGVTSLSEYVYALEIFPNVDDRDVVPLEDNKEWDVADPAVNGSYWGYTWWYVANILWDSLAAPSEVPPLEIPFLLPAISSHYEYEEDGTRNTLSYNLSFFTWLCYTIRVYTRRSGGTDLDRMALGVNYGWDHRGRKKSSGGGVPREGPLHLGHLKREITLVKEVLHLHGLDKLRVFVLDTGISVNDADEFVPNWMTDRYRLQAYEVWRRVAGALACGAAISGWQSWMSTDQEDPRINVEGYGMGLRNDNDPYRLARNAWPRSSWFAYRRMVENLSSFPGASLIYPVMSGTAEPTFSEVEMLLIYRFVSVGFSAVGLRSRYAYLLLPDITAPDDAGWSVTVDWSMASPPADAVCTRRPTLPNTLTDLGDGDLPSANPNFDADVDLPSLPQLLMIYVSNVSNEPILLLSNYALVFDIKYFPLSPPPRDPQTPPKLQPYPIGGSGFGFPDLSQDTVYLDGVKVSR